MIDKPEDIRGFLENLPDTYDILEEGIDFRTQKEYIELSKTIGQHAHTDKEIFSQSCILFDNDQPIKQKKIILLLLAHLGTIEAFRQIEKYYNNPDKDLKQWTLLSLQECKMFVESSILDKNTGFISTGLGGYDNRLRYYFLILPSTDRPFTKTQKDIIRDEFAIACSDLNSILETFDFFDTFAKFIILVPLDVAVGAVIENGIKKCNEMGEFVFEQYFVTNQSIPDQSEIIDIVKVVKGEK